MSKSGKIAALLSNRLEANFLPMNVDTALLRQFLIETFNADELKAFLFDYFPLVSNDIVPTMSMSQRIQMLLEHCQNHQRYTDLFAVLERDCPGVFQRSDFTDRAGSIIAPLTSHSIPKERSLHQKLASYGHDNYDETHFFSEGREFENHILSLLESNKNTTIRRYLRSAKTVFYKYVSSIDALDDNKILSLQKNILLPFLDNLLVIGKVLIEFDNLTLFKELERTFYQLCKQANSYKFPETKNIDLHFTASWVWQEIIRRIYALGGLLVQEKKIEWIPILIRQTIDWDGYYKSYFWARYFLIMLSRERRFRDKSLCSLSITYLVDDFALFSEAFMNDKNQIVSAICQFDFLQCIHVAVETSKIRKAYPSFGIFNNYRTEPIILDLIQRGEFRNAIPKISDSELANIIQGLDYFAGKEFARFNGWDSNYWSDSKIEMFISKYSQATDE